MALFRNEITTLNGLFFRSIFFVTIALSAQMSFAQAADENANIEEVIVLGQQSLGSMKRGLENAQNDVFDLFNETFEDTEYEMICLQEKEAKSAFNPIANSWTVRTCASKFVRDLRDEAAEDYLDSAEGYGFVNEGYYDEQLAAHREGMYHKLKELYETNPEFREQFTSYVEQRTKYQAALEADAENDDGNFFTNLFR